MIFYNAIRITYINNSNKCVCVCGGSIFCVCPCGVSVCMCRRVMFYYVWIFGSLIQVSTNMTILMSAVLTLTALLPLAPSYIAHHLPDLFEVFSRLAAWRSGNRPTGENTIAMLFYTCKSLL